MPDLNVGQHTKAGAAVENAAQFHLVLYDEDKRDATQAWLGHFVKRVDRIESSKEPEPAPSSSGKNEISACSPSPIADNPSALPSPTSSPSFGQ